jgi:hypothetical protein
MAGTLAVVAARSSGCLVGCRVVVAQKVPVWDAEAGQATIKKPSSSPFPRRRHRVVVYARYRHGAATIPFADEGDTDITVSSILTRMRSSLGEIPR